MGLGFVGVWLGLFFVNFSTHNLKRFCHFPRMFFVSVVARVARSSRK